MNGQPTVTILIANQNYEEYLEGAIQSAIDQDYPHTHICVVDDGSEDNEPCVEILTRLLGEPKACTEEEQLDIFEHDKYTILRIHNKVGPSQARNVGIEHTWDKSDYYLILDADDKANPDKISVLLSKIHEVQQIAVAYADYTIFNTRTHQSRLEYKQPFSLQRLYESCIVHSGALIKKEALSYVYEQDGYYYDPEMRVAEDYDLWVRIAQKYMIVHVAKFLSWVRVQPKNSTDTVRQEVWNQCLQRIQQKLNAKH